MIEILVSMVLALITFLVMLQMFESWDKSKRSTASGGGAMISGSLGMFRLERDLRLAGFGFGNASETGCTVNALDTARPVTAFSFRLMAVLITDGALGAPDSLTTLYGSSEEISTTRLYGTAAAGAQAFTSSTTTSLTMDIGARGGMQQGDLVVIAPDSTTCHLVEVTDTSNTDRRTFSYGTADYTHFYTAASTTPRYNQASVALANPTGNVYVLGPRPQRRIWQIRNGRTLSYGNDLRWVDTVNNTTDAATPDNLNDLVDVADNIVNLQAEYGLMATVSGAGAAATCVASSTPIWTATTPSSACLPFVWAVRVAILARSDQFEKTWGVPAASGVAVAPSWASGTTFTMSNVDGTTDSYTGSTLTVPSRNPNDWRHYRYKVSESIIPLKNVMWASRP